ncbi:MAG: 2'-5' RNA ligase family protein [Bacteroidota bacterium]
MESLYFIAIVPPKNIQREITLLKQEIAKKYGSKHALKSPPHITLHMPFRWKDKKLDQLTHAIKNLNTQLVPFRLALKDFNYFEPHVVYIDVVKNLTLEELQKKILNECRKKLKLNNANYKNQPFHPHVTIGFRDLKKQMFYTAKEEFEKRAYSGEFRVKRIELLKHDGKRWNVLGIS